MIEFLKESFLTINLPVTLMLLVVLAYWMLSIVGLIGQDILELPTEFDADALPAGSALKALTSFFYLGDIPIVIVGSFAVLFMWIGTMTSNHYLNDQQSMWVTAFWLIPNLVGSLLLTKLILMPLAKLFEDHDRPITRDDLFGKVGRITTSTVTPTSGQLEIEQAGPPISLNVRSKPDAKLAKGDYAKIIGYNPENDTFLVELTKWEKP